MHVPVFITYERVNPRFLQNVLMGRVTPQEAREMEARMTEKRDRYLRTLIICAAIAAVGLLLMPLAVRLGLPGELEALPVAAVFASVFFALVRIVSLVNAVTYLRALRRCRPGSLDSSAAERLYKINKQLIAEISAGRFSAAEARGIRNIAEFARAEDMKWAVFGLVAAVVLAIAAFLASAFLPGGGAGWPAPRLVRFFPAAMSALFALAALSRLARAWVKARRVEAINRLYPE
ncbi:MAG: hypothetical protein LBG71_03510 [Clostridiales Family XIII bacterium]|jgi:hypothetical protein|nr:hypothetical protein [Clostridiales Family XIII bacterium]